MTTNLQQLFRLNAWANRRLLEACRSLDANQLTATCVGTYGSIERTLAHLVSAEDGYVARLTGEPRQFRWNEESPTVPSIGEFLASSERTGAALVDLAGTVSEDAVLDLGGGQYPPRRWPAWVVLDQVVDHGREHRTHVATILTQLGITPPEMDLWAFDEAEVTRLG